jgi:hypothetical protein
VFGVVDRVNSGGRNCIARFVEMARDMSAHKPAFLKAN